MSTDYELTVRARSLLWNYDAGRTRRFHAHPSYSGMPLQTVAEHTWGVVLILLVLCDMEGRSPSTALLRAAMRHDLHERITGDVAADTKWMYPDLRDALKRVEADVEDGWAWRNLFKNRNGAALTEYDHTMLKWADSLELWVYSMRVVQENQSRSYAEVARNIEGFLRSSAPECEAGLSLLNTLCEEMMNVR